MADIIDNLPVDREVINSTETEIVEKFFKEKYSTMEKIINGSKESFMLFVIFVIVSLPVVNSLITKVFPVTNSEYTMILAKGVILVLIFFIVKNLSLVRR